MKVRIYKPSKTAMQSIHAKKPTWVLECEQVSRRMPEPLMGWTCSDDTLNQVKLKFSCAEDAVSYAQKQGWEYTVTVDRDRRVRPRNYLDNFKFIPSEDGR
ncbi:MAG TPA: ETC complex I subunit [Alphaproteobacteria bacterium]|nr:ETC complex I subunit [Alphaproteobacteria bacterium]